jgi:hypothetical protein
VATALDWARHNQCHALWVEALARFTGAAHLLERLEFADGGVLHRHFFNEDVRLFEKLL